MAVLYRVVSLGGAVGTVVWLFGSGDRRWLAAILGIQGLALGGLVVEAVRVWGGYYGTSRSGSGADRRTLHRAGFWFVVAGHVLLGAACLSAAVLVWP